MGSSTSPASMPSTGLPDTAIRAIQQVLAFYPEVEEAILYGSRALDRHRAASDIDLTLTGTTISASTLARIDADLDDLLLPWVIDLSAFRTIRHPALLAHIEGVGVTLYRRANPASLADGAITTNAMDRTSLPAPSG